MLRCGVIVLALILILVLAVRPRQLAQRGYRTPSTMAALSLNILPENVATSEATSGAAKVWPEKTSVRRFARGEDRSFRIAGIGVRQGSCLRSFYMLLNVALPNKAL